MKHQWFITVITIAVILSGVRVAIQLPKETIVAQETAANKIALPLSEGTYWLYEGVTKWTEENSADLEEKKITWRMEVIENFQRGHLNVAVIKGHPADLVWYREGKQRGDYLIVEVNPGKYYLVMGDRVPEVLTRLKDEGDFLANLLEESELFLESPLRDGQVFGPTSQLTRLDGAYRWNVEQQELVGLKAKRIASGSKTQYRFTYRTAPDRVVVDFIPGVGMSRYQYLHHGTVSEIDVKLIEFQPGKEPEA
ncbi:hypothetical protein [Phormidium sp. CCY1219]|uniref:hypothetical protein n=1 Tax=Phormidium sp. CCY1219 TaxID=2886104 RepID=UPI002D1E53A0|nr:hypothetical protein [Phormidium sp. CCY1219]MEB3828781.1 hypothetical protein [Phormidium sp. CCY1219]